MNNNEDYSDWFKKGSKPKNDDQKVKEKKQKDSKFSDRLKSIPLSLKNSKLAKFWKREKPQRVINLVTVPVAFLVSRIGRGLVWFNDKKLLRKILYTILLIIIFRIAASITTPGITIDPSKSFGDSSFLGIMNLLGGGTLSRFSIVALGISPYITASIIMTLLQSEAFPPIHNLSKSGPKGKRKINVITRIITLVFAILQAITMIQQFASTQGGFLSIAREFDTPLYRFVVLPMVLIGGSMFTLFLGEQITNKGVGNGTSLIIFSGIAARLPDMFKNAWIDLVGTKSNSAAFIGIMNYLAYVFLFLIILFIILYIYKSVREIPIQQTGAGMTTNSKQMSRLPIKLNPGGVMPIIFGLMIMSIPLQVVQFFNHQNETRIWIQDNLKFTDPLGLSIMALIVFVFAIAMGFVTFNPATIAENFKKNGTFIPGIRPGKETEDYLSSVVLRLGVFSGFYLAIITSIKYFQEILGFSPAISFGGTTVIILVSVAVETLNQITARETTHKLTKQRVNSISDNKGTGGLLW